MKNRELHQIKKLSLIFCTLGLAATSSPVFSQEETAGELEEFTGYAGDDPNFVLPTAPIEGSIGFSKSILETPRSVSVISSELISSLSLSEVSDLSAVVPSTNTKTRWGVQGNIDVRNMTADTYFRGMKRIEPQGNSRTVLAAMDQIEIHRGPPSPFLGAGKIGGYTNMTPKSGRSQQGKYLEGEEGFISGAVGTNSKREVQFGYGGPLALGSKLFGDEELRGGYYIFGLIEDSDSHLENIPIGQRVLQFAISQDLSKGWRLEMGMNYQETAVAGGFMNRISQDLVDNGKYIGGGFLVNLDTDNSGKVSEQEMFNSYAISTGSNNNTALLQRLGNFSADRVLTYTGNYATAMAALDPRDGAYVAPNAAVFADSSWSALQTAAAGGNTQAQSLINNIGADQAKLLTALPQGFIIDPAEVVENTRANYNHVALEKELLAKLGLVYIDLINDSNANGTKFKNQTMVDSMDQFKDSELPFYQKQDIFVFENKFTIEYDLDNLVKLPDWLQFNTISSLNFRYTDAERRSNSGDYDDRPDLSLAANVRTPNDTFITPRENDNALTGGAPFSNHRNSIYKEAGIGTLGDITFFEDFNLLLGARYDYIQAETTDLGGVYRRGNRDPSLASSYRADDLVGEGDDKGLSYMASFSYKTPFNIIPYVTYARQTALADSSDLTMARNLVEAGAYAEASLTEIGIKGSMFDNKFFWAVAYYEQMLASSSEDPSGNPLVGGLSDVEGKGLEIEATWAPNAAFYVRAFAVFSETLINTNGQGARVHGETLGFEDVVLDDGTIFPAEAFTFGGQPSVLYTADSFQQGGSPETSYGVTAGYTFDLSEYGKFNIGATVNYNEAVPSGTLAVIELPEYTTLSLNFGYVYKDWKFKFDVKNATDELYFIGRNGTSSADALMAVGAPRQMIFTVSKSF
jgi:outer membrane receptor for ferric coprogen and ferric-rhodotorulic acid